MTNWISEAEAVLENAAGRFVHPSRITPDGRAPELQPDPVVVPEEPIDDTPESGPVVDEEPEAEAAELEAEVTSVASEDEDAQPASDDEDAVADEEDAGEEE